MGSAMLSVVYSHLLIGWLIPITASWVYDQPSGSSGLAGVFASGVLVYRHIVSIALVYAVLVFPRVFISDLRPGAFSAGTVFGGGSTGDPNPEV